MSTLALEYIMLFVTNQYQGDRVAGFVIGPPRIGSWQIQSPRGLLGFVLVILAALTLFQHNVQRRAPGRYWRSIRESDLATASIGIPVVRWKLLAFVWSSAVTAVAGALFAWVLGLVVSNIFSFQLALTLALMVFLGGRATISGPILGAAAVTLFPQGLTTLAASLPSSGSVGPWLTLNEAFVASGIYGLALLVVLLAEPDGIVGLIRSVVARVSSPRSRRPQASASSGAVRATRVGDGQSRPSERTVLAVSELTLRYGNGALGVEGLSFTVEPGQIVALVGRNGAGKTSTLRAIAGFPRAERVRVGGVMRIGDQTVRRHDPVSMRKLGVVLVPERDKVFPTLTVAEHLRLTRLPEAEVEAVYERFPALDQLRERRAGLLSGGERQLVALAAATAVHPLLLLVDEPSLGLSPVAIQNLVKELIRLRNETGMSVLLTEQISETLVTMADAVHVLAGGQIMLSGGTEILQHNDFRAAILGGPRDFRNS
jgi:ABC-type branched-subunit amino acid transport system ATPase component